MKLALLVLFAALLPAQPLVTYFVPGSSSIGPYTSIGIRVCNGAGITQIQTAADLQREAAGHGILLASNGQLLTAAKQTEGRSWQRNLLMGAEIAAGITTSLIAAEVIVIKERWKAVIPIAGSGVRITTTLFKPAPIDIPPSRPTVLQIPAGSCEEMIVYGSIRGIK